MIWNMWPVFVTMILVVPKDDLKLVTTLMLLITTGAAISIPTTAS